MKLIKLKKYLALLPLSMLTACVVAPSFSDMSQAYQTEVARYSNNNLLLNVVRSSKQMPMSFLDIPSVLGSGSIGTSASLMDQWYSTGLFSAASYAGIAGGGYYNSASLGMTTNRGFNFTQSSLDNADFIKGFLSPLNMANVSYFANGQQPKYLVFNLLIASLSFTDKDGKYISLINDPYSSNFGDFQKAMNLLVSLGLTTEMVQKMNLIGPTYSEKSLIDGRIMATFMNSPNKGGTLLKKTVQGKDIYQYAVPEMGFRFCFNPVVAKAEVIDRFGEDLLCNGMAGAGNAVPKLDGAKTIKEVSDKAVANTPAKQKQAFSLQVRSPNDVFSFLGVVTYKQLQSGNKEYITVPSDQGTLVGDTKQNIATPILMVEQSVPSKKIAVIEYDDEVYAVPLSKNGFSSATMNILSQLVSICKVAGSIPPSPAVLVK
jgi:hypothetical protein